MKRHICKQFKKVCTECGSVAMTLDTNGIQNEAFEAGAWFAMEVVSLDWMPEDAKKRLIQEIRSALHEKIHDTSGSGKRSDKVSKLPRS